LFQLPKFPLLSPDRFRPADLLYRFFAVDRIFLHLFVCLNLVCRLMSIVEGRWAFLSRRMSTPEFESHPGELMSSAELLPWSSSSHRLEPFWRTRKPGLSEAAADDSAVCGVSVLQPIDDFVEGTATIPQDPGLCANGAAGTLDDRPGPNKRRAEVIGVGHTTSSPLRVASVNKNVPRSQNGIIATGGGDWDRSSYPPTVVSNNKPLFLTDDSDDESSSDAESLAQLGRLSFERRPAVSKLSAITGAGGGNFDLSSPFLAHHYFFDAFLPTCVRSWHLSPSCDNCTSR
jgi:hypothetical protein